MQKYYYKMNVTKMSSASESDSISTENFTKLTI